MFAWIKKLFGTSHERAVARLQPKVDAINAMEAEIKKLSDAELKAKTASFKEKLDNGASLDDILVPAFAVCREAGWRVLKMRHFDVQLIGGMVLHGGIDRRDAHRRGQDAGRHPALLLERARGQGRARRHGQRLPRAPRLRVDGALVRVPRPVDRRRRQPAERRRRSASRTAATSPTARTTSSASTTCATT
jgi:hypothetical protein